MTDELKAEREAYSKVIKSLAAIVMCQQTDEQCELELLPREPVMLEVIRIRQAMDDFMKQARAKLDRTHTTRGDGDE